MKELSFYDVKTKKKFVTTDYRFEIVQKNNVTRKFAVAKSPEGEHSCWRVVKADYTGE